MRVLTIYGVIGTILVIIMWGIIAGIMFLKELFQRQKSYRNTKRVLRSSVYGFIGVWSIFGVFAVERGVYHVHTLSEKRAIKTRYEQMLEAFGHLEYEKAYEFMSPAYRKHYSFTRFKHHFRPWSSGTPWFYIYPPRDIRVQWDKTKGTMKADALITFTELRFVNIDGIWYLDGATDIDRDEELHVEYQHFYSEKNERK